MVVRCAVVGCTAIEKSCLINYLTPKKKEIKIMKAETLFRINLFCLFEEHTDIWTTFYRECRVYYYNLSTGQTGMCSFVKAHGMPALLSTGCPITLPHQLL